MTTTSAAGVRWDLSDLFASHDDPQINATLDACDRDAATFAERFRGTISLPGGPDPEQLRAGLEQLEALYDRAYRTAVFASLLFSADTSKPEHRNLQQTVEQRMTNIRNQLLFFDLEWLALDAEAAQRAMDHPVLAEYRHYLMNERRYKLHTLSEPEERIINEKDVTGRSAWQRLFAEVIAALNFTVTVEGEVRTLSIDGMLSLMRHPDRETRKAAFDEIYRVLGAQSQLLAFIYNTLIQEQQTMNRLRDYADPMIPRHLANEIEPEVVQTMMAVVERNYGIAQRYFAVKAKRIGVEKLHLFDQYAPVGEFKVKMTYDEARATVLTAFGAFDDTFRTIAARFFEHNWIDAEIRSGKRGGAFCSGFPPSNHPYILCNYTDDLRDVMTIAHELGHGIHFWLSRKQSLLNFGSTLPLAETASVFAEMLTFEHLLGREQTTADKLALVSGKIEDIFATVYRQNVLTRFEQSAFAARAKGRLTPEQIGELWLAANAAYYGDTVELSPGYEKGWSYISHFVNVPFYCYAYVFGELLVLALYGMYRDEGSAFTPRYLAFLEAGISRSPADLLAELGVDPRDPAFWQKGFDELDRLVRWAEELAQAL